MNPLKVIYSENGLANYYGTHIEIHPGLKYNKPLRDHIVKHEMGHSPSFDLGYEVSDGLKLLTRPKIAFMLMSFYARHPSTWKDFLPIQKRNNNIMIDINLSILYALTFLGIGLGFWLF